MLDPIKPALILPEVVDGSKWLNGEHFYADSEKQFVFMYEGSVAGVGLAGMRERVCEIGGDFRVRSGPQGTSIRVSKSVAVAA